jgi:hypothetical protein
MLDKNGTPINGTGIDWLVQLALLAYLVGMIWKTGRTLGTRVAGLRVIDTTQPGTSGVPIHKAVIRYLAMAIGFVPMLAVFDLSMRRHQSQRRRNVHRQFLSMVHVCRCVRHAVGDRADHPDRQEDRPVLRQISRNGCHTSLSVPLAGLDRAHEAFPISVSPE